MGGEVVMESGGRKKRKFARINKNSNMLGTVLSPIIRYHVKLGIVLSLSPIFRYHVKLGIMLSPIIRYHVKLGTVLTPILDIM